MRILSVILLLVASLGAQPVGEWSSYSGDPGGMSYSPLRQIHRGNAERLQVAWTFRTGALEPETQLNRKAAFEATPLMVDDQLIFPTPFNKVFALDPTTGKELWSFDPEVDRSMDYSEVTSRGVAVWRPANAASDEACAKRVFVGTIDARLIALDLATGRLCSGFGKGGTVDLVDGIDLKDRGDYQLTSPPAVIGDLVVVGSSLGDNRRAIVESGAVRAYDARTGKLTWRWDPLPADLETGAANAWAPLSVDEGRDLVFVPTGSASPDFHGGMRPGEDRWANSVVALRGSTGKLVWGFQVVHHDLWDYDVAAQPTLIEVQRAGESVAAVAVNTKMGHYFLLDRETGEPLLDVEEREVPVSDVAGEAASRTQPFPTNPPLMPTQLDAEAAWGLSEQDLESCREQLAQANYAGLFTPPSVKGSIFFPGNVGGVNWGGAAFDPESGLMVAMVNRLATLVKLIPAEKFTQQREDTDNRLTGEWSRQTGAPYGMYRETLLGPSGIPCIAPPWGSLVAVNAADGEIRWRAPLGEIKIGEGKSIPGDLGLGGPLVTAGGLVVIGASRTDQRLHIHDIETGAVLAQLELPANAQATPMSYQGADGRQYIVISAGGHGKLGNQLGDYVVAFALDAE
ncbi:MAG: pyrroloquinoline quinone-dependent dehydrogenase [Acidobacteria bacterium]|nr:pyrroloquinoline quinone-dependent dehydrogenase [Acidobacteriota bacterium]MDA1234792.1 pyrroloquinoline quinone-dependent dehydrogenase [Acidobacteriota bacterium]